MKRLMQMLTECFTKTDLQPAVGAVEGAADRHAEYLHGVYTRRFFGRWDELCEQTVAEFTRTDVLLLEEPCSRADYEAMDYAELRDLVKQRELKPAGRSAEDLVEALVADGP